MAGFGVALLSALAKAPGAYQESRGREIDLGDKEADAFGRAAGANALAILSKGPLGVPGGMGGGMPQGGAPGGAGAGPQPPPPGIASQPLPPPAGPMMPGSPNGAMPAGAAMPRPGSDTMPTPGFRTMAMPGQSPPMPPMPQQISMRAMAPPGGPFNGPPAAPPGLSKPPLQAGGMPPQMAQQPRQLGQQPQQASRFGNGPLDWRQAIQAIQQANPGISPQHMAGAMKFMLPYMTLDARQEWLMAHNQYLEDQLKARTYGTNLRYGGGRQPIHTVSGEEQPGQQPAGQPAGQPPTQRASAPGGPDLSGGEQVIKTAAGASPAWTQGMDPEVANSPAATGKLPKGHAFASTGSYTLKPEDMNLALAIYQYRRQPFSPAQLTAPGDRGAYARAVMSAVDRLGADNYPYDAADWDAHKKGTLAFGTGVQGNTIRSVGTAMRHMDTLNELAEKLDNEGPRALNAISNILQTQFGRSDANNIEAAKQIIAQEVVKAVVASGGGVRERLEAAAHIDQALVPSQIRGVTDTYRKLLDGQLEGFRQQFYRVPGNKDKDFDAIFGIKPKGSANDGAPAAGGATNSGTTPGGIKWSVEPVMQRAFGGSSERTNEPDWQPVAGRKLLAGQKPSTNIEDRRKKPQYYRSVKALEQLMENTSDPAELEALEDELQGAYRMQQRKKK